MINSTCLAAPCPDEPDGWHCNCPATKGDPDDFCDSCRWDYDCWLDSLAADAEAEQLAEEAYALDCLERGLEPTRFGYLSLYQPSAN